MSSVDKKLLVGLLPANDMAESGVPAGVTLESAVPPTGSPPPDAPTTAPVPGPPTSSPAPDAPTSCTAPPTPANEPRFKARYSVIKCCDCDDHGTKRYNQNGEADIKPCAYKCPFCTYQVANGGRHGSTIRKHIITCHVGQNKFKNMSVKQGTGRLGSYTMRRACDSPSADEQSEEEVDIEEEDPEVVALAMASRPKAVKRKAAADVARPRLRQKQA